MHIYKIYLAFTNKAILWYFPLRGEKKRKLNLTQHSTCNFVNKFKKPGTLDSVPHDTVNIQKRIPENTQCHTFS